MKPTLVVIALVALSLVFQADGKPVPKNIPPNPPPKDDKALLQGEWTIVSVEAPAQVKQNAERPYLTVKGDEWLQPSSAKLQLTFKIDAAKTPKQLDLISQNGQTWQGIFKIDGDTFTLCRSHGPGGERPTAFEGGPGIMLMVFKRAAK